MADPLHDIQFTADVPTFDRMMIAEAVEAMAAEHPVVRGICGVPHVVFDERFVRSLGRTNSGMFRNADYQILRPDEHDDGEYEAMRVRVTERLVGGAVVERWCEVFAGDAP